MNTTLFLEIVNQLLSEGLTSREACEAATEMVRDMRLRVRNGEDARDVLDEYGYEIDFVVDII